MDDRILSIVGILIGALGVAAARPLLKTTRILRLRRAARRRARRLRADLFTPLSIATQSGAITRSWGLEEVRTAWAEFHATGRRLLLIKGRWGQGKTTLVHLMAAGPVADSATPYVLDASRLESDDLQSRIVRVIAGDLKSPLLIEDLWEEILWQPQSVLFVDALDQLPALYRSADRLSRIIGFATQNYLDPAGPSGRIVLVVRQEYFEISQELQNVAARKDTAVWTVEGFRHLEQILAFAAGTLNDNSWRDWEPALRDWFVQDAMRDLLQRPQTLKLLLTCSLQRLQGSQQITLAEVFKLSVADLDEDSPEILCRLEELALAMLKANCTDYFTSDSEWLVPLKYDKQSLETLVATGLLVWKDRDAYGFDHASMRDFLVARLVTSSIGSARGRELLSSLRLNFQISEFVAALISRTDLAVLWEDLEGDSTPLMRMNFYDILTEIDEEAKTVIASEVERLVRDLGLAERVGPEHLFEATLAGAFGLGTPVKNMIECIQDIGIDNFLESYFVTRNRYEYYGGTWDSFADEWTRGISVSRYRFIRTLMCHVMGAMRHRKARPAILQFLQEAKQKGDTFDVAVAERALRRIDLPPQAQPEQTEQTEPDSRGPRTGTSSSRHASSGWLAPLRWIADRWKRTLTK